MKWESRPLSRLMKKGLLPRATVNKVQVIPVQHRRDKPCTTGLYELHAVSRWRLLQPDSGIDGLLRGSARLHDLKRPRYTCSECWHLFSVLQPGSILNLRGTQWSASRLRGSSPFQSRTESVMFTWTRLLNCWRYMESVNARVNSHCLSHTLVLVTRL